MGLETAAIIGIGAAALSAGSVVTSAIISNNAQKKANETNIQLAREQMAYQTSEREAVQEYNLPEAQRARFEQAGINPYFALSNINSGNADMQTGVTPASVMPEDALSQLFSGLGQMPQNMLSQVQGLQQVQATEEAVKQARIESQYKGQEKLLQMHNLAADVSVKMSQVDKNSQEYKNLQQEHNRLMNSIKAQEIDLRYLEDFNQSRNKSEREKADLLHNQALTEHYVGLAKKVEAEYAERIGAANLNRINAAAAAEYASASASHQLSHLYSEQGKTEFEMRVLNKANIRLDNEAKEVVNSYIGEQIRTQLDLQRSMTGKYVNETNIFHSLGPAAIGAAAGLFSRGLVPGRSVVSGFK